MASPSAFSLSALRAISVSAVPLASPDQYRGAWRTRDLCEALGVSRGRFYEWLRRPQSHRSREKLQLLAVDPRELRVERPNLQQSTVLGLARFARLRPTLWPASGRTPDAHGASVGAPAATVAAMRCGAAIAERDRADSARAAVRGHGPEPALGRRLHCRSNTVYSSSKRPRHFRVTSVATDSRSGITESQRPSWS